MLQEGRTEYTHPEEAAIGNTGEIVIRNCARKYMQMDIKKKFLSLRLDSNGVYSLWTDTSTPEMMTGLVIEVQVMRRALYDNAPADTPENGADQVFGWTPYGSRIIVGYNEQGSPVCEHSNLFNIRYCGPWHWTIDDELQDQGLLAYGLYKQGDSIIPVRYQYLIVETNAYKYEGGEFTEQYDWVAVLPYAWDGAGSQVEMYPRVTAQDQDRLINVQASNLIIRKDWADGKTWDDTDVAEVYVKIYRYHDKNYNGTPEDYTNYIGTSLGQAIQSSSGLMTNSDGYVASDRFYPSSDSNDRYLVLDAQHTSITVEHMLLMPVAGDEARMNYYWVQECGYKLKNGDIVWNTEAVEPVYTTGPNTVSAAFNSNQPAEPVILLTQKGNNIITITNKPVTPENGSLVITKGLQPEGETTEDVFSFDVVLTNEDGTAYSGTVTITDHERSTAAEITLDAAGGGRFTVTIQGAGSAAITGIPAGTNYTVTEQQAAGWTKTGEVYSDETKTISAGDVDTAAFTNARTKTDIHIEKVRAGTTDKLTGAVFKLEKLDADGNYSVFGNYEAISIESQEAYTVEGLTDGTYRLTETKAPAGYIMLSTPVEFTVENGTVIFTNSGTVTYTKETGTFTIGNSAGSELPHTGGPGTLLYTVSGLMLVGLAGVLIVWRKRRKA